MVALIPDRHLSAVQWARVFINPVLRDGSRAVDATAGNGHDTLYLARSVGPLGRVYAMDIQDEAVNNTRSRLEEAGLLGRVSIIKQDHSKMLECIPEMVDAVMFNLGYLPGSNRMVKTRPDTTLAALNAALSLLKPGGRLSIVVYTGHQGAAGESRAVNGFLAGLAHEQYSVIKMNFYNGPISSPEIYFVTRQGDENGQNPEAEKTDRNNSVQSD